LISPPNESRGRKSVDITPFNNLAVTTRFDKTTQETQILKEFSLIYHIYYQTVIRLLKQCFFDYQNVDRTANLGIDHNEMQTLVTSIRV
jgi:hypothetical protein